jgi:putative tryptophan/tyrosine transport system substrate-binding protein
VIRRRDFSLAAAALAAAPGTRVAAQAPLKIGWLTISQHAFVDDFRERLRELGYVEGTNLVIEYRYAQGNAALLPGLVQDLAKAGVSILVVSGSAATDAAAGEAKGVPIVFVTSDPTITGQISSLARPGGLATGISTMSEEIASKKIDLLRDAVSRLARLAVLNDGSPGGGPQAEGMAAAARKVGIESKVFSMADPDSFARVFAEVAEEEWQAVAAVSSPLFTASARSVADLTIKQRLPAIFDTPAFVRAGALMSYGADLKAVFRRQAELVQRLARGAKLADMPVEQASKFIFAFNQTTAKAMGISLSLPVMASVDDLVE